MLDYEKEISKIEGWLTKAEAECLYDIATTAPRGGKIVEIGSWKGKSTITLAKGSKEGNEVMVYAIDPHLGSKEHLERYGEVDTYQEFLNNISMFGVRELVTPIRNTSENASKQVEGNISFVFVDGAHEYKFVKIDFEKWFPKLANGGVIAFHDCWHAPGVHLLTAIVLLRENVANPRLIDTMTVMQKVESTTAIQRISNTSFLIFRLLLGWIGTIKMDLYGDSVGRFGKKL